MNAPLTLSSPLLTAIVNAIENDPRLKSRHSTRQYRSDLIQFEEWRGGRTLTKSLVEEYASALQKQEYAPATINQRLSAIRWWVRRVIDQAEEYDDEHTARIARSASRVLSVEGVRGKRLPRGRYLSRAEQEEILNACRTDPSPAGARDAAMIAVALSVGFRRDDITTLDLDAIQNETEEGCDLIIHGKGDRVDTLFLYDGGYRLLRAWLEVRGMDPGPVFCQVRKNDKVNTTEDLSGEALRKILDERQVGLSFEHITWHDLRKTFACTLLDAGVDLATVQKLMRHADPSTTSNIYDIRRERAQREAVRVIQIGGENA